MRELFNVCVEAGFFVLKINHRGVGKSVAVCNSDDDSDELNDASHALDWLKARVDVWNPPVIVVGYSHGAWNCLQLTMRRPEIIRFVAISPLVMSMDFSFLSPCPVPGLVIHGELDEITKPESVEAFVFHINSNSRGRVEYKQVQGTGHLYQGDSLKELSSVFSKYITENSASGVVTKLTSRHRGKKGASSKILPVSV